MIDIANSYGKIIFVDPKGNDFKRYKNATIITPNRFELSGVIGKWDSEDDLHRRVEDLREELSGIRILLTRSEEGMTLFENDEVTNISAEVREVSDVTGAGDTVIATMAVMVACGLSFKEAMMHANRAGGLVIQKFGTATISYDELFKV